MIALNHSFLEGIAHTDASGPGVEALKLIEHVRKRTGALPYVHETLASSETGEGDLIQWANRQRGHAELRPFVELLLRMVTGPFLPDERFTGPVEPPVDALADWLADVLLRLLAPAHAEPFSGLISPAPNGGADSSTYKSSESTVWNWHDANAFDLALSMSSQGSTLEILRSAAQHMDGQLVILPSAVRSAEAWTLDCKPAELHRALLGLEVYADALRQGLHREVCAEHYHRQTTIPMSEEKAAVSKNPAKRQRRTFVAGPHGRQYFDMHAKPGPLTRVHIWTPTSDGQALNTPIYVGYCGKHL